MKCEYCKEKLDPKKIAYCLGKRVHPKCFEQMKWQEKHLTHEERIEVLRRRVGREH